MTILSVRTVAPVFILLMALAWLAGCAPVSHTPGDASYGERLGILRIVGSNVFCNQRRAVDGEPVYVGDKVSTGNDSNAWIYLTGGGFIRLDENTDPWLERRELPNGRICIHLRIDFGRVWVDSDLVCIDTLDGAFIIHSVVNIDVMQGSTIVTVFRGSSQLVRPVQQMLQAGEQVTIARNEIGPVRKLDEKELEDIARWQDRFPRPDSENNDQSQERCLRNLKEFIASQGLQPDRQGYSRARECCARGDFDCARAAVQEGLDQGRNQDQDQDRNGQTEEGRFPNEEQWFHKLKEFITGQKLSSGNHWLPKSTCLRKLKEFIASQGLQPDRHGYSRARECCVRGDFDCAMAAVQEGQEQGRDQDQDQDRNGQTEEGRFPNEEQCLRKLKEFIADQGLQPDRQGSARARECCVRGDFDCARAAVQEGRGGKPPSSTGWCCTRNGGVLPSNHPQCKGQKLYTTEEQARQAGPCRIE